VLESLQAAERELKAWSEQTQKVQQAVAAHEVQLRVKVEHKLSEQGLDAGMACRSRTSREKSSK
jgi:hypothetical protein